jgi:glutathione reductase (NADPH)
MLGENAAEIIQTLAVAIRQGITRQDLNETIGIHPTIAENFLSLG